MISASGRVAVADLGVESARLSQVPLTNLTFTLEGEALLDPSTRHLTIEEGIARIGDASLNMEGELAWTDDRYLVDLALKLPRTNCGAAVAAIPHDLLGKYQGFDMAGKISGSMKVYANSTKLGKTALDIEIDDDCRFASVPEPAELDRFAEEFHHIVRGREGIIFEFDTGPDTEAWTPIEQVSPFFLQAVLAHEDAGFFEHEGFAVYAMESALERNLKAGEYVVGASTISMQLAKNLFLERDKTLGRKVQEVMLTWLLESNLTKREVLELYVNVIEYGPEIFGVRHAARHYFGRQPLDLTPAESAFLASSLPAPVPRHRQYEQGELWNGVESEVRYLLGHMARKGRLDGTALDHGLRQLQNFEFHYGDDLREPEHGMGQPGELPFDTDYVEQTRSWWRFSDLKSPTETIEPRSLASF